MIRDHWYRTRLDGVAADEPCAYSTCGRPKSEHQQSVGEWMEPGHWFLPSLHRPAWCRRCDRSAGHGVHRGSRARRRLWGWH